MKKIIIATLITLYLLPATAQEGLHLGILAGPQFSAMLNSEDNDNDEFRLEPVTLRSSFGIVVDYHFTPTVGVGTQLLLSYQGQKYYFSELELYENFRKLKYFRLPILLHVNSDPENVVGGYFNFGPQFSFLLKAEEFYAGDGIFFPDETVDTKEYYKNVNIGMVLGFGLNINATEYLQFNVGLRLDAGLTDAVDQDAIVPIPNPSYDPNATQPPQNEEYLKYSFTPTNSDFLGFTVDRHSGERSKTWNITALIEIGARYILNFD